MDPELLDRTVLKVMVVVIVISSLQVVVINKVLVFTLMVERMVKPLIGNNKVAATAAAVVL